MGVSRVVKRTLKRHGIKSEWSFPFAPMAIPYRKFEQKDWHEILGYLVLCMILFFAGSYLLQSHA